ncbi:Hypothetical predicted protein [Scomber scombrus]|uniref:Uncharacterized protein n=1 Tax=Scomber scombrus TaxID=13677 RepID=A0AAV1PHS7_SCOSC
MSPTSVHDVGERNENVLQESALCHITATHWTAYDTEAHLHRVIKKPLPAAGPKKHAAIMATQHDIKSISDRSVFAKSPITNQVNGDGDCT